MRASTRTRGGAPLSPSLEHHPSDNPSVTVAETLARTHARTHAMVLTTTDVAATSAPTAAELDAIIRRSTTTLQDLLVTIEAGKSADRTRGYLYGGEPKFDLDAIEVKGTGKTVAQLMPALVKAHPDAQ
ncbi:unnamed protein product [Parajaminaea phylloscopi]